MGTPRHRALMIRDLSGLHGELGLPFFLLLNRWHFEIAEEVKQAWGVAIWQQRRARASWEQGEVSFLGAEGWSCIYVCMLAWGVEHFGKVVSAVVFGNEWDGGAKRNTIKVAQCFALKLMKNNNETKNPNQEKRGALSSAEMVVSSLRISPSHFIPLQIHPLMEESWVEVDKLESAQFSSTQCLQETTTEDQHWTIGGLCLDFLAQ